MNGSLKERLLRFLPLGIFGVLLGLIFGGNGKLPDVYTVQDLAIYLAMGVLGLLVWVVQRVIGEQHEIAEALNNHLGGIAQDFGKAAERLSQLEVVSIQSVQYMAMTSAILERMEDRVLQAALRISVKKKSKAAKSK